MKSRQDLIEAALNNQAVTNVINMRLHQWPAVPWSPGARAVYMERLKVNAAKIARIAARCPLTYGN